MGQSLVVESRIEVRMYVEQVDRWILDIMVIDRMMIPDAVSLFTKEDVVSIGSLPKSRRWNPVIVLHLPLALH